MKTLYLCYFGLREPLVQTQVLPYLREIAGAGIQVNLLTFEPTLSNPATRDEIANWSDTLHAEGIDWFSLTYHKRPSALATGYDIIRGALFATKLARRRQIDVLHARSHVPMAMALLAQRLGARCRLIFDIRGLMAEEYADAGVWAERSVLFRLVKKVELKGIQKADQVIVLTRKYRDFLVDKHLKPAEQVQVVPCCFDFARLETTERSATFDYSVVPNDRTEMIYAGSVTGLYLLEEMGRFFLELKNRRPGAHFRILTKSSAPEAAARLERAGLQPGDFSIAAVPPADVPRYLRQASVGISFRKAAFSQIAASPTKIPEYLAAGLPVICNSGIGDTDELLTSERVGVILSEFNSEAFSQAMDLIDQLQDDFSLRARCQSTARNAFDIETVGRNGYREVYRRLKEKRLVSA
jgi:glycosyltransferase involved in cell wall biosynthesis